MDSEITSLFSVNDKIIEEYMIFSKDTPKILYLSKTIVIIKQLLDTSNYLESLNEINVALNLVWEDLQVDKWLEKLSIRQTYTILSYLKAVCLFHQGEMMNCMETLDMGLIMGAPVNSTSLNTIASSFHEYLFEYMKTESSASFVTNLEKISKLANESYNLPVINYPIERKSLISIEYFLNQYHNVKKPLIIEDAMKNWPAMQKIDGQQKWNLLYLYRSCYYRKVPIEIGSKYDDDNWTQKLMTIGSFVEELLNQKKTLYLAQHQIFDQINQLRDDIRIPDYCCLYSEELDEPLMNVWIGPSNTISPLHTDQYDNILCQVNGYKYIRLYDPVHNDAIQPYQSHLLSNTSPLGCKPVFESNKCDGNIPYIECILKSGEMLFIPKAWWHYVQSFSISFSVSFWWK